MNKCSIDNCNNIVKAKNLCNKHYVIEYYKTHERKKYVRKTKLCNSCLKRRTKNDKCSLCLLKKEIDMRVGENAWNWNNGSSLYKKQRTLLKNRKIVFNKYENKCQHCFKEAEHIHHKDLNKENHNLENLLPLCRRCHFKLHSNRENKTKFSKIYGLSLIQISKKLNLPYHKTILLHKMNLLKKQENIFTK